MKARRKPPSLDVEAALARQGAEWVVGLDEVGRGALAGPVMVGAVALRSDHLAELVVPEGLADSKLLTPAAREGMVQSLEGWAASWAVGSASNQEIDQWGIMHALGLAALRALEHVEGQLEAAGRPLADGGVDAPRIAAILDGPYDYIGKAMGTLDAPSLPLYPGVTTKVKADASCASVACASVIAKVTRDRLMVELAQGHPEYAPYGWERNKGYGSRAHQEAIARLGPTAYHRLSWHLA
ncbi:ribonuclease HII [Bifidobacterium xylocopae]|uniref:Ribonuclease n=1 Tax=Bifidobacterium xylocopae TaxID=2493119 RepID=A0A366KCD4_9BIFI|nr:ribonuclease HII [Bifidobacterium xylocopae]RBP99229.1 ribonuclease HII [Bifidobacterium xylocopae]